VILLELGDQRVEVGNAFGRRVNADVGGRQSLSGNVAGNDGKEGYGEGETLLQNVRLLLEACVVSVNEERTGGAEPKNWSEKHPAGAKARPFL
jgi:hypothetical protein